MWTSLIMPSSGPLQTLLPTWYLHGGADGHRRHAFGSQEGATDTICEWLEKIQAKILDLDAQQKSPQAPKQHEDIQSFRTSVWLNLSKNTRLGLVKKLEYELMWNFALLFYLLITVIKFTALPDVSCDFLHYTTRGGTLHVQCQLTDQRWP